MRGRLWLSPLAACLCFVQAPAQEPRFAVEIERHNFPPSYTPIATSGTSSLFDDLAPLRLQTADPQGERPSALKLDYTVEGDLVQITATAFYGDFDRQQTPTSLNGLRQQKV